VMERARDLVEKKLDSGELDRLADRLLETAGASSGSVPASSVSTPGP
jgi:hypothetical protein